MNRSERRRLAWVVGCVATPDPRIRRQEPSASAFPAPSAVACLYLLLSRITSFVPTFIRVTGLSTHGTESTHVALRDRINSGLAERNHALAASRSRVPS
jgi:hypothetical protein